MRESCNDYFRWENAQLSAARQDERNRIAALLDTDAESYLDAGKAMEAAGEDVDGVTAGAIGIVMKSAANAIRRLGDAEPLRSVLSDDDGLVGAVAALEG